MCFQMYITNINYNLKNQIVRLTVTGMFYQMLNMYAINDKNSLNFNSLTEIVFELNKLS